MSMILDVAVIVTLGICIVLYTKRGFIKGVLGLCGCLIAMIAAMLTKPMLQPLLVESIEKTLGKSDGTLSGLLQVNMTADVIADVIAFALLFVLYIIAVRLVTVLLDRFCRLPVLKQANKLLGFALGIVIGLLYAQLLSVFLFTFSELLLSVQGFITEEAFEGSVVARWMFDHNLFRLLINML